MLYVLVGRFARFLPPEKTKTSIRLAGRFQGVSTLFRLRVVVDVKDVILRGGLDSQVAQQAQNLGAVIGAVIRYMEQHLPHGEVFILFRFLDRLFEQHIVP